MSFVEKVSEDLGCATPSVDLLQVSNLSVKFQSEAGEFRAVDGIQFDIERGRTLGLVGESGCGKSVTSLAIMGLLASPPAVATGRIWFEGRDLFALPAAKRRKLRGGAMSMIFQEPMTSLNPVYTVGDQIVEMLRAHGNCSHSAGVARALEVLDLVKIPAARTRMNDYPHQFSGGMRQRVMIAMALACRPRLLIADEPTTALDVTIQAEILDLLREVQTQTGTAILMITHDLGVIAEIADTVAVMYAGKIIEQGSAKDLFNNPQHPYTIGLLGSIPRVGQRRDRLATIEGSVPRLLAHPAGCRFSPRCPFAISQCRGQQPPLVPLDLAHSVACWRAPIEQNLSVSAR